MNRDPARIAVRWAVGLPLVAGLAAVGFLPGSPWWLQLALAVATLGGVGYLFQTSAAWLFGPVLAYELVRQTRTPRVPALRTGYALLLLAAMFLVYLRYTPGTGHERMLAALGGGAQINAADRADFAANFFYAFLALQFVTMLLFTPALVGGAIITERRRGTLDLLFTTDLSNREIVLGKLGSQLAYLFLLLLTGLPILSLLQLLGGIEPNLIVLSFLGTVITLGTLGAVSMVGAAAAPRLIDALKAAYGLGAVHVFVCFVGCATLVSKLQISLFEPGAYGLLALFALYNAAVTVLCVWGACRTLRPIVRAPEPEKAKRTMLQKIHVASLRPAIADRDPMVWKEIYYERGLDDFFSRGLERGRRLGQVIVAAAGVLLLLYITTMMFSPATAASSFADFWNALTLYFSVPALQAVLVAMTLRAAVGFSREREAQTYEALLVTTLSDWEILRAKWLASVWNMRFWCGCVGILYVVAMLVGGVSPWALPLALVAFAVHVAFAVNLGLYCSAAVNTTLRATVTALGALALVAAGHWLVALAAHPVVYSLYGEAAANRVYDYHLWALTLPFNLAGLSFYGPDAEAPGFVEERLIPGLAGVAYYALLALLLLGGIYRRMRAVRRG